jgi:hypothetical protein
MDTVIYIVVVTATIIEAIVSIDCSEKLVMVPMIPTVDREIISSILCIMRESYIGY